MDFLHIKGLTVTTRIGVYAWEQQIDQKLLLDISIPYDFSKVNEQLTNTIDYNQLCQQVTAYIESNSFQLIETVANRVAELIKSEFNIKELKVSVSKPGAIKNAANIEVCVNR